MENLIDTLSFFFGCLGAFVLVYTLLYIWRVMMKIFTDENIKSTRQIAKETIEELNKTKKK